MPGISANVDHTGGLICGLVDIFVVVVPFGDDEEMGYACYAERANLHVTTFAEKMGNIINNVQAQVIGRWD